ncbi:primosomal protein N' [Dysgonomonas sp. Marseille-P4677]|uniref:replication restart helicase PriA n=1 Tax=Dysgonomonas sp. Marseille-P4677 TaxID=2364790 RepID=UPI0019116573|nr:primosomal protein N' [Dysgonomonas sp. Marseille-P4677]MBK5720473.1 primosomal protein N' [Dysgonomonas sp. Marseille-P4677]
MLYADVVLPLPLQGFYTYIIPPDLPFTVKEGSRVIVQFGKKKFYTAIVFKIYESEEKQSPIKDIVSTLEDTPIVTPLQMKFWEWVSFYYMCSLGDVYKAAVPSALKLESETHILLNSDFEALEPFTSNEQKVFFLLSPDKPFSIAEIEKKSGLSNIIPTIKSLTDKKAIYINENIQNTYTAKTQPVVRLAKQFTEEELNNILDELSRAKKQQYLLSIFLDINKSDKLITKKRLLDETSISPSVLSELVKKGFLDIYDHEISRFDYGDENMDSAYMLNIHQQKAYTEITNSFKEKETTLLYGVTSSGKTEIYIQLIKDAISKGKQVLYLLPEIALTTQITNRLKTVFGNKLAVYHSRFNDNERAETWKKLLKDDEVQVILGARSAIFLPFNKLDLIIVDEEHEGSYKQQDPAPRYNARNSAIVLANMHNAKVLLGTATPSIESYNNALSGRYGLVRLTQRHENIELPHIAVINTKELRRKKQMKSILSPPLIDKIRETLNRKEQVILFQNRRGFSSMLECKNCSWTPHCTHCDVSLTYHKYQRMLVCHYCGATYNVPTLCDECKTPTLEFLGYGTERIEEEVNTIIPEASIARMDLDTTRGKKSYEQIISKFENNETNILIGTQMISKGLDFDNVSIVGILNADNLLNYPDFRAYEKAYQLMTQVSGRAGRKNKQGLVILQTAHPEHPLIKCVRENDYESFYLAQLEERRLFRYPPFFRLISIVIRGRDESLVENTSTQLAEALKQPFGERILGPSKPAISRIQSLYIRNILLKIENNASIQKVREMINYHQSVIFTNPAFKSILLHYDVDPM